MTLYSLRIKLLCDEIDISSDWHIERISSADQKFNVLFGRNLFFVFDIDNNIIQIHNNKNIKFFYEDFINIALKCCWNISQSKRYYLILKMTVSGPKNSFLLIFCTNSHPVIGNNEVELSKSLSLP